MNINIISLFSEHDVKLHEALESLYRSKFPQAIISHHFIDATALKDCIGCWNCWVKTPGLCIHKDKMDEIYKLIISSDQVVLALSTQAQFLSGAAKTFIDRLIPLFHPYIIVHKDELMHEERYHHFPVLDYYFDSVGLSESTAPLLNKIFQVA